MNHFQKISMNDFLPPFQIPAAKLHVLFKSE